MSPSYGSRGPQDTGSKCLSRRPWGFMSWVGMTWPMRIEFQGECLPFILVPISVASDFFQGAMPAMFIASRIVFLCVS